MAHKIIWLDHSVIINLDGVIRVAELHEIQDAISGDPRFDHLHKRIFNCLSEPFIAVNDADIKIFAYLDNAAAASNRHIHVAVVAHDAANEERAMKYSALCQNFPWKVAYFNTMMDAFEWQPEALDSSL